MPSAHNPLMINVHSYILLVNRISREAYEFVGLSTYSENILNAGSIALHEKGRYRYNNQKDANKIATSYKNHNANIYKLLCITMRHGSHKGHRNLSKKRVGIEA